jgi:hypothetical protein
VSRCLVSDAMAGIRVHKAPNKRRQGRRKLQTATLDPAANMLPSKGPVSKSRSISMAFTPRKTIQDADMSPPLLQSDDRGITQYVLWDGNTADARMMATEYIASGKVYDTLPKDRGVLVPA